MIHDMGVLVGDVGARVEHEDGNVAAIDRLQVFTTENFSTLFEHPPAPAQARGVDET